MRAVKYGAAARPFVRTNFSIGKLVRTVQYGEAQRRGLLCALILQLEISAYGTVRRGAAARPFVRNIFSIGKLVRKVQYVEARRRGLLYALLFQLEN